MNNVNQTKTDLEYSELLSPLWSFLSLPEPPIRSDIIFVFGCIDMKVPEYAAKLWRDGFADKILVTGESGLMKSNEFSCSEAEAFAIYMKKFGVPENKIIVEPKARNTGENAMFGMDSLAKNNIYPKTLLLVARPFCMQRCVATFRKLYPDIKVISCPTPGDILDYVDRPRPEFALRLVAELARLENYPAQGFTVPVLIPDRIREASDKIVEAYSH